MRPQRLLQLDVKAKTILTYVQRILGNLLLNQDLVSEIIVLIYPFIIGRKSYKMLSDIEKKARTHQRRDSG
jgi:hypothetical protein